MINNEELAKRVVAVGVGQKRSRTYTVGGSVRKTVHHWWQIGITEMGAEFFMCDWRVVGALLDKVHALPEPFKWITVMRAIRRIPLGDPWNVPSSRPVWRY